MIPKAHRKPCCHVVGASQVQNLREMSVCVAALTKEIEKTALAVTATVYTAVIPCNTPEDGWPHTRMQQAADLVGARECDHGQRHCVQRVAVIAVAVLDTARVALFAPVHVRRAKSVVRPKAPPAPHSRMLVCYLLVAGVVFAPFLYDVCWRWCEPAYWESLLCPCAARPFPLLSAPCPVVLTIHPPPNTLAPCTCTCTHEHAAGRVTHLVAAGPRASAGHTPAAPLAWSSLPASLRRETGGVAWSKGEVCWVQPGWAGCRP